MTSYTVGTPFQPRIAEANRSLQWREWAGYVSPSVYGDSVDLEYTAIRTSAALIDVSPLYKYRLSGPDALRLVDRVITRHATLLQPGRVIYSPWCDEAGHVIDDGTLARLDDGSVRWTAADPQLRGLNLNAGHLDVTIDDISERTAALALQGPLSRAVLETATGRPWGNLGYYRRQATTIAGRPVDVSRTGYTGDLGYELWIDATDPADAVAVWDAVVAAGAPFLLRPAGLAALDIVRVEAGLILLEVDYTSARHALAADQAYSPGEIGLGRLVDFDKPAFTGRRALLAERDRGGPPRRLVGLVLGWDGIERLSRAKGVPPVMSAAVARDAVPLFSATGRQVGRITSRAWSPTLKSMLALASVEADLAKPGTTILAEWTVEGSRGRVDARVVELPFLDLPRKRS
jgi:aminomethyltransferase